MFGNRTINIWKDISSNDLDFSPRLNLLGDSLILEECDNPELIQIATVVGRQTFMRGWKKKQKLLFGSGS